MLQPLTIDLFSQHQDQHTYTMRLAVLRTFRHSAEMHMDVLCLSTSVHINWLSMASLGGRGKPPRVTPSRGWQLNEIKKIAAEFRNNTGQTSKRGRKVGDVVTRRRQEKRSSLCRRWWLKRSSVFFQEKIGVTPSVTPRHWLSSNYVTCVPWPLLRTAQWG